ncbi:MAG: hypothetical protein ABIN67_12490 [Ferruginibacter sp.]
MDVHDSASLKAAIAELQERQRSEKQELSENVHALVESLKPMNLIKSTFHNVTSAPGFGGNLFNTALSLGAGILSKKLLIGPSTTIFKKIAGNAVKAGVTGIIAKKSNKIRYAGLKLLTKILGKKKEPAKVY